MKKHLLLLLGIIVSVTLLSAGFPAKRGCQKLTDTAVETGIPTKQIISKDNRFLSLSQSPRPTKSALRMSGTNTVAPHMVPKRAEAILPRMIGTVISGDNWTESNTPYGLYDLPDASDKDFTLLHEVGGRSAGTVLDGIYYHCKIYTFGYKFGADWSGYDIETGARVFYRETYDCYYMSVSTSVDPETDKVYGLNYTANGRDLQLVTIDYVYDDGYGYNRVDITPVANLSGKWAAIAFDGNGQLWGIAYTDYAEGTSLIVDSSSLYKIDKNTGATTLVGNTGLLPQYASDMDFDRTTNRLYWTIADINDNGYLAEINTATGVAERIVDFPHNEEVVGLTVIPPPVPGTPDKVSDVSATFDGGSLSGTLNFTAPEKNTDGTDGTGTLTYTVTANGISLSTGQCHYGEIVNAPVTVDNGGDYTFSVTVTYDGKSSKAVSASLFVGFGTPKATEASASWADGMMTVSWSRPTETVDGGYLSPTNPFVYEVRDYDTDALLIRVTDGTTCSFAVAEPAKRTTYRYKVTGTSNGMSFTSITNSVPVGSEATPYLNDFSGSNALEGYTIIDANNDGKTWVIEGAEACLAWNTYMAADDWMITVPIKLEGGKEYPFSIDARIKNVAYSEKFEVKAGLAPTAEAMDISLIPETVVTKITYDSYEGVLRPETTGAYYIGVHGISLKDRHTLIIDNLKLDEAIITEVPASVQGLEIIPDPTGALKATVNFTTPSVDNAGHAISSLQKIEIKIDDAIVKTLKNPAVGEQMSHTVNVETPGLHTFTVISFNETGEGTPAVASTYIGFDVPATSARLSVTEPENGVVSFEWEPVTTDINGTTLPKENIVYDLYIYNGENDFTGIAENLTETSYNNHNLGLPEGKQSFFQFVVFARTAEGTGEGRLSDMIPIGYPSEGFIESFSSGGISNPLMVSRISGAVNWVLMIEANGFPSQDDDNGLISMIGEFVTDTGALTTGKFTIEHLSNPALRFYAYNIYNGDNEEPDDANTIVVKVAEAGTGEYNTLLSTTFSAIGGRTEGWYPVEVDLSSYKGKTIQITLESTTASYRYSPFDNFRTFSKVAHNLHLTELSAPSRVEAGSDYSLSVKIANEGYETAENYNVELYCDGTLVNSIAGAAIAPYATTTVEIPMSMPVLAKESLDFHAVIVHAPDMITENNTSDITTVTPVLSIMPCVTDLSGYTGSEGFSLEWNEPDFHDGIPTTVTDDFESYESWINNPGDWITIDVDKSPLSMFLGFDIPGVTPGETLGTFMVFDHNNIPEEDHVSYGAHSGHKYMGAIQRYDNGKLDDWLVSPELSGNKQVISFYAKSSSRIYPDSFRLCYSTGSTEPTGFIPLTDVVKMPHRWTLYSFEIPAGAKHFAINAVSENSFLFMLDDATYQSGTERTPVILKGYNIWRDGKKLNENLLTECCYTDPIQGDNTHKYVVTAVYDLGESAASNEVIPGVGSVSVPGIQSTIEAIYSASGVRYKPDAKTLPAGVYIIRYTDGTTVKSIVR